MGANRTASVAGTATEPLSWLRLADAMAMLRGVWARTHVRWLVGILVVALVLRVVWVVAVQPDPRDGRFDDTVWYYGTANRMASGDGYVFPGDIFCQFGPGIGCDEFPPTALWAPGYSTVLAGLFQLPGDDVAAARALNVVAGLALVLGVYYLGQRLWSRRAGLLAAAIIALFPSHIFFSSLVLTETLFVALSVGLLCLVVAWTIDGKTTPLRLVGLGLAAGALAMVRPEGIVFVGVIFLTWLVMRRSWRWVAASAGLVVVGMAVFFVPWTVRNAIQLDALVVGTNGMGQVLLQGHHAGADGEPEFLIVNELWERYAQVPLPERELRVNRAGISESLEYAVKHPGRELSLAPRRLAAFYRGDRAPIERIQEPSGDGERLLSSTWANVWSVVSDTYYYVILAAGFFGLYFWVRRSGARHWLLWGPFLAYTAMWTFLFVGESRYHFALLPTFALIAAIGLAAATARFVPDPDAPQGANGDEG